MLLADRYRLDEPLGRGAMGEVWRAWDVRLSRPVAVKMLAGPAPAAGDAVARFEHEARTAARLSHPHAVGVYDVGTADGHCFLVMELVPGRTLAQELREEGPLAPARVAEVAAQTAEGLAAAHLRGVVHRDIKPSNLLAGEDGSVKIADFGIAHGEGGETTAVATRPGAVLGTSLYLSPEAAMGGHAGPPADVYGLGCSLYELLTGQPPFAEEHPVAVLRRHVEDDPVPPRRLRPDTPRGLDAYLLRMLAKQPELRPTAGEVAEWFAQGAWRAARQEEQPGAAGVAGAALPATRRAVTAVGGDGAPAPRPAASPGHSRARRTVPVAGAVTAAAAIAAATFVFASPTADGNSPSPLSRPSSSQDAGTTTAPPGGAPAHAADASARDHQRSGGPGAAPRKRPSGSTATAPTSAPAASGAASQAPTRRSGSVPAPVPTSPGPAPRTAAPPSGGSTATAGPTAPPTTPPADPPATTAPADGGQGS